MSTKAQSEVIEALVGRTQESVPADVYHLRFHPYEGGDDHIHLAIIADVGLGRLNQARSAIAKAVEEANLSLGFEPQIVFHTAPPESTLSQVARKEGVRLWRASRRASGSRRRSCGFPTPDIYLRTAATRWRSRSSTMRPSTGVRHFLPNGTFTAGRVVRLSDPLVDFRATESD